ncbi:adenylate/guanylate cyclase domain-containing protein [Candidatus Wolfebacteria bacterium]|nr:adenylate/guanylate cyclase domain-containing protein [Candidatus Wolfebacteria bacterium]
MKKHGIIALSLIALFFLFFHFDLLQSYNSKITDNFFLPQKPNPDILIIGIDDKSLQEIGRWPWDRTVHAELINSLIKASPKVIALDINFFEPSGLNNDEKLEKTAQNPKVIFSSEAESLKLENDKWRGEKILKPIFNVGENQLGYENIIIDADGVVRRIPSLIQSENKIFNSFSAAVSKAASGKNYSLPQTLTVNFRGKAGTFPVISYADALKGKIPREKFSGKIILVGPTAPDFHDQYIVPTSKKNLMNGVEIHANAINTIMSGDFISEAPGDYSFGLIFLSILTVSLLFAKDINIWLAATLSLSYFLIFNIFAILMFEKGFILNVFYPDAAIFVSFFTQISAKYLSERKEKQFIKKAFRYYLSEKIIDRIIENPKILKPGGTKKTITIFFSDIRGFTTLSETLPPERVGRLLNEYFAEMSDIILKNDGFIDKFIGDAIMALWGVFGEENHTELACRAALQMKEKLKELNEKWGKEGYDPVKIGVGIHRGEALVGNFGSFHRFDYTAIGDSVNLASRLEGLNKEFGTEIIISEASQKNIKGFETKSLGEASVKGKREIIKIFELIK